MRLRAPALVLALLIGSTCAIGSGSALSAAAEPAARLTSIQHGTSNLTGRSAGSGSASGVADQAVHGAVGSSRTPGQPGQPSAGIGAAIVTSSASGDTPAWLAEVNRYRLAAGLGPVTEQPSWDAGILAHLNYVAKTPKATVSGPYASLHTESPASTYYSTAGALEAGRSDLYFGSTGLGPVDFIDGWLRAPFHAIGLLRGRLTQVAFAASGGAAGLDVIGGLDDNRPDATGPILFPGNGMTTNLTSYTGGESPDPLETCGWTGDATKYGLPLIALLPSTPKTGLAAQVEGPDGRHLSTANGQLCVVDEVTYRSSDPVYGPTGKQILQDDHAVLLIAQRAYAAGSYSVAITQPGSAPIAWSFTVAP